MVLNLSTSYAMGIWGESFGNNVNATIYNNQIIAPQDYVIVLGQVEYNNLNIYITDTNQINDIHSFMTTLPELNGGGYGGIFYETSSGHQWNYLNQKFVAFAVPSGTLESQIDKELYYLINSGSNTTNLVLTNINLVYELIDPNNTQNILINTLLDFKEKFENTQFGSDNDISSSQNNNGDFYYTVTVLLDGSLRFDFNSLSIVFKRDLNNSNNFIVDTEQNYNPELNQLVNSNLSINCTNVVVNNLQTIGTPDANGLYQNTKVNLNYMSRANTYDYYTETSDSIKTKTFFNSGYVYIKMVPELEIDNFTHEGLLFKIKFNYSSPAIEPNNNNIFIPKHFNWNSVQDGQIEMYLVNTDPNLGPVFQEDTLDTDGDGLPDTWDKFPNDPNLKYDDDNDGVANKLDAFPYNSQLSLPTNPFKLENDINIRDITVSSNRIQVMINEKSYLEKKMGEDTPAIDGNIISIVVDPSITYADEINSKYYNVVANQSITYNTVTIYLYPTNPFSFVNDGYNQYYHTGNIRAKLVNPVIVDTDGDGYNDFIDAFPNDPNEWLDTDGDGVGDNADAFPNDANEQFDTDGDGVGDNADDFPNNPNLTVDPNKKEYTLELYDSYGDGWNNASIDVFVNNNLLFNNLTFTAGNFDSRTFKVRSADIIKIKIVQDGGFPSEASYKLVNENNEILLEKNNFTDKVGTEESYSVPDFELDSVQENMLVEFGCKEVETASNYNPDANIIEHCLFDSYVGTMKLRRNRELEMKENNPNGTINAIKLLQKQATMWNVMYDPMDNNMILVRWAYPNNDSVEYFHCGHIVDFTDPDNTKYLQFVKFDGLPLAKNIRQFPNFEGVIEETANDILILPNTSLSFYKRGWSDDASSEKLQLNIPGVSGWDTSNVTSLSLCFYYCTNVPDLSQWNLSSCISLTDTLLLSDYIGDLALNTLPDSNHINMNSLNYRGNLTNEMMNKQYFNLRFAFRNNLNLTKELLLNINHINAFANYSVEPISRAYFTIIPSYLSDNDIIEVLDSFNNNTINIEQSLKNQGRTTLKQVTFSNTKIILKDSNLYNKMKQLENEGFTFNIDSGLSNEYISYLPSPEVHNYNMTSDYILNKNETVVIKDRSGNSTNTLTGYKHKFTISSAEPLNIHINNQIYSVFTESTQNELIITLDDIKLEAGKFNGNDDNPHLEDLKAFTTSNFYNIKSKVIIYYNAKSVYTYKNFSIIASTNNTRDMKNTALTINNNRANENNSLKTLIPEEHFGGLLPKVESKITANLIFDLKMVNHWCASYVKNNYDITNTVWQIEYTMNENEEITSIDKIHFFNVEPVLWNIVTGNEEMSMVSMFNDHHKDMFTSPGFNTLYNDINMTSSMIYKATNITTEDLPKHLLNSTIENSSLISRGKLLNDLVWINNSFRHSSFKTSNLSSQYQVNSENYMVVNGGYELDLSNLYPVMYSIHTMSNNNYVPGFQIIESVHRTVPDDAYMNAQKLHDYAYEQAKLIEAKFNNMINIVWYVNMNFSTIFFKIAVGSLHKIQVYSSNPMRQVGYTNTFKAFQENITSLEITEKLVKHQENIFNSVLLLQFSNIIEAQTIILEAATGITSSNNSDWRTILMNFSANLIRGGFNKFIRQSNQDRHFFKQETSGLWARNCYLNYYENLELSSLVDDTYILDVPINLSSSKYYDVKLNDDDSIEIYNLDGGLANI